MTDKARWNVRTVAADEDRELWNQAWRTIKDTEGSKPNKGFCKDDEWLFTPDEQRMLYKAAVRYACTYSGDFQFMLDIKEKTLRTLPSEGAMWAILNCMKADFRRRCAAKRAAAQAPAPASAASAPGIGHPPGVPMDKAAAALYTEEELEAAARQLGAHLAIPARPQAPTAPAAPAAPARVVENGYYTVNMGDGTHVTLRLDDDFRDDAPQGAQVAAYLGGSDNENDYFSFAFVQGATFKVWKKWTGKVGRQNDALITLLTGGLDAAREAGHAYALQSGRCARCGRLLTVEASVNRGLGPECAKKAWND